MTNVTKKNVKAHERSMKRLAKETLEPKRLLKAESESGSNPAFLQDVGTRPARTQGTEETVHPQADSAFVHEVDEAMRDAPASSSKLPVETVHPQADSASVHGVDEAMREAPANADDSQDYMILDKETHPSSEEKERKPSEVLKGFLKKYQSRSTRDLPVRTKEDPWARRDSWSRSAQTGPTAPEMEIKTEVSTPKPTPQVPKTDAQHYILATPPVTPTRPNPNAELHRSPPGLGNKEYPNLGSAVPTRHEEKTIAQKNLAIARKI